MYQFTQRRVSYAQIFLPIFRGDARTQHALGESN
jgi:hypothetical protein